MKIEILNDGDLTCFKGTATLVEEKELETFDNYIHEIAEEYCKMTFKEKDQILTQRLIKKQDKEIERLNNIINELEKCIKDEYDYCDKRIEPMYGIGMGVTRKLLDKLKELKEKS